MIARLATLLLALFWAGCAAWAQVPGDCIDETSVWTVPYSQGSIQAVSYYVWQQSPPGPHAAPPLLLVVFRNGDVHMHQKVPSGIAQKFSKVSNADQTYESSVKRSYQQLLLAQNLCPLRNETGTYLLGEVP